MESHDAEFSEAGRGHMPAPQPQPNDPAVHDAIEWSLWQSLADALNDLFDWGLMPLGLAAEVDTPVIHGSSPREGGYKLRYQAGFMPDPEHPGEDLPSGWQVVERTSSEHADGLEGGER